MAAKYTQNCLRDLRSTFDAQSTNSSAAGETLCDRGVEVGDEEDDFEGPMVFTCGKCKLPIGDSLSWDGGVYEENQIKLKRVTENVLVGKENRLLEVGKKSTCVVVDLFCKGCHSALGIIYTSTPKLLDHKRLIFFFNVASIESYMLGSASQVMAAEDPAEQPVTLEYRGFVEQQLSEMKMLVVSMAHRLEEIEGGLQDECDEA